MVSFTFDDGWGSQYTHAAPMLEKRGWKGTFYLVPGWFGKTRHGEPYVTLDEARALAAAGHDIGAHTMTHPHLPLLSRDDQRAEMVGCRDYLASHLQLPLEAIESFASPYGDHSKEVRREASSLFSSHRGNEGRLNTPATDPYLLGAVSMGLRAQGQTAQTGESPAALVGQAASENQWLVLLLHGLVAGEPHRATVTSLADLERVIGEVELRGLRVVTIREGVRELRQRQERGSFAAAVKRRLARWSTRRS
jgi:peptidoglycan/xylan/chitin deacetylase (PgdA/CDA1 family)